MLQPSVILHNENTVRQLEFAVRDVMGPFALHIFTFFSFCRNTRRILSNSINKEWTKGDEVMFFLCGK